MTFEAHKPGQGTYARVTAAVALGVISLAASAWLHGVFIGMRVIRRILGVEFTWGILIAAIAFVVMAGFTAFLTLGLRTEIKWLKRLDDLAVACADFLIETETELRRVSWPTRDELVGSTAVVIFLTLVMGAFVFVADSVIQLLAKAVGVL